MTKKYKKGDIVLVKSIAGDAIPNIHIKLNEKVVVKPTPGKLVGFKKSMDWPGYEGWYGEIVYQEEADILRRDWSIPLDVGDVTFIYDHCIIRKARKDNRLKNRKTTSNGDVVLRKKRKKPNI